MPPRSTGWLRWNWHYGKRYLNKGVSPPRTLEFTNGTFTMGIKRKRILLRKSKELNENLPESERWFWREWKQSGLEHKDDLPNAVLHKYIPDVMNNTFKYVIEIDGDSHENNRSKNRDTKKDRFYKKRGFTVFRLKAYDNEQLGVLMDEVEKHRIKCKTKIILRRVVDAMN